MSLFFVRLPWMNGMEWNETRRDETKLKLNIIFPIVVKEMMFVIFVHMYSRETDEWLSMRMQVRERKGSNYWVMFIHPFVLSLKVGSGYRGGGWSVQETKTEYIVASLT